MKQETYQDDYRWLWFIQMPLQMGVPSAIMCRGNKHWREAMEWDQVAQCFADKNPRGKFKIALRLHATLEFFSLHHTT
jgi:hypothetical protein